MAVCCEGCWGDASLRIQTSNLDRGSGSEQDELERPRPLTSSPTAARLNPLKMNNVSAAELVSQVVSFTRARMKNLSRLKTQISVAPLHSFQTPDTEV